MKESIRAFRGVRLVVYPAPAGFRQSGMMDHFPLKAHWQAARLLMIPLSLIVVGLLALSAHQAEPFNPLLPYAWLMPGHNRDEAIRQGAVCITLGDKVYNERCTLAPQNGPFEKVSLSIREGQIVTANFTVRSGALYAGDLEYLWGKPIVYSTPQDEKLLLQWSAYHVSATVTRKTSTPYAIRFLSLNHIMSYQ